MASNNQLLGSGVAVEKAKIKKEELNLDLGWCKRLYHKDCISGKKVLTLPEQNELKKLGWVESPADLDKVVETSEKVDSSFDDFDESVFDAKPVKKSKIDLSEKKTKKGK